MFQHIYFHAWHWFKDFTGAWDPAGPVYNSWSGWIPALAFPLSIIGMTVAHLRSLNCHQPGCWHLSHHTTAKGYRLCKRCIALPIEQLDLHEIHEDHQ